MATSDRGDRPMSQADGEWHRWQMQDLGQPEPERGRPSLDADIQRRRQQKEAEEQARRAVADKAQRQGFENGYREGKEQGYEAGYREGLEAANAAAELEFQKRLDLTLRPLVTLADNFRQALTTLDGEVADQLVELALIAGRQLAGESLAAKPEHILSVVRELLDADTALTGKPRLWLHPQDRELVMAAMGDLLTTSGWECHADPTLERGGCRATSAAGGLDASLSTQWKAILDQRRQRKSTPAGDEVIEASEVGEVDAGEPQEVPAGEFEEVDAGEPEEAHPPSAQATPAKRRASKSRAAKPDTTKPDTTKPRRAKPKGDESDDE